jgi:hypothetical protein
MISSIQIMTRKTIKGQQVKLPRLTLESIINKLRMLIVTLLNMDIIHHLGWQTRAEHYKN